MKTEFFLSIVQIKQQKKKKKCNADHTVDADVLVVHGYCQRRCQNRLDKVNERSLGRGGILRDLRRKQKAKSCAADADMAQ